MLSIAGVKDIAAALRRVKPDQAALDPTDHFVLMCQWANVVEDLSKVLSSHAKNFDAPAFQAACGWDGEEPTKPPETEPVEPEQQESLEPEQQESQDHDLTNVSGPPQNESAPSLPVEGETKESKEPQSPPKPAGVFLYTDAPTTYDGFGATTVQYNGLGKTYRGEIRKVLVPVESLGWQQTRWESGEYLCLTEEQRASRPDLLHPEDRVEDRGTKTFEEVMSPPVGAESGSSGSGPYCTKGEDRPCPLHPDGNCP